MNKTRGAREARESDAHPRALRSVARPKQQRSRETLQRILDAAEHLIEEKGLADASIPEIVRRAGSSVGGFYARFRDKNELLRALEERFFGEQSDRLDELTRPERWEEASVPEIVRGCVEELVGTFRSRRPLISAFLSRAVHDPDFIGAALRFRGRVTERMSALLLARREQMDHPKPERAIDICVQLAFALMHESVIAGEIRAAGRSLSDARLREELSHNFLSYLGVSAETVRA